MVHVLDACGFTKVINENLALRLCRLGLIREWSKRDKEIIYHITNGNDFVVKRNRIKGHMGRLKLLTFNEVKEL